MAKHTHKYQWQKLGKSDTSSRVLSCVLPDCTHYIPAHMEHKNVGRKSLCNSCGEEFNLSEDSLTETWPRCDNCRLGLEKTESSPVPISDAMQEFLRSKES